MLRSPLLKAALKCTCTCAQTSTQERALVLARLYLPTTTVVHGTVVPTLLLKTSYQCHTITSIQRS